MPIEKALQMAKDANLDLIEIAPTAKPPVCRVLDLGKYIYEKSKKERQARKSQTKIEIKEIRLRPKTNEHHRMFKVRDARRWLEKGMQVQVTIRFRGREITFPEIALEDLKEIAEELKDVSIVEQAPSIERRAMHMLLVPLKGSKKIRAKSNKPKQGQQEKPSKRKVKKVEEDKAKKTTNKEQIAPKSDQDKKS